MKGPYLLLLIAPLFWGGGAVVGKLAVDEISPVTLTFYRWLIVSIVLLPVALPHLKKDFTEIKRHIVLLFSLGVCGFSAFNLIILEALHYTSAIKLSIEQAVIPIFIFLGNFIFLKMRCSLWQMIGLSIAIFGVITAVSNGNYSTILKDGINRGDIMVFFTSLLYAAYSFGLRWRPKISWLSFFFVLAVSACVFSLPFYLAEDSNLSITEVSWKGWVIIAYFAVISSICAELSYAKGVSMIGSNRAGQFINLVPIFGMLLSVLVLGENFHWYHGAGLILVLSGIILAEKAGKASKQ